MFRNVLDQEFRVEGGWEGRRVSKRLYNRKKDKKLSNVNKSEVPEKNLN